MDMRRKLKTIAMLLGLGLTAQSSLCASPEEVASKNASSEPLVPAVSAIASLLAQARLWEARGREDLVGAALEKLLAIAPNHPEALTQQALLEIRKQQPDNARQTLARLRQLSPQYPGVVQIETLLRLESRDSARLQQARSFIRNGKPEEALAILKAIYPAGPPTPALALEYWQVVGDTVNGWDAALKGLQDLQSKYPDDARYKLALAEHVLSRQPNDRTALERLSELAKNPETERAARAVWRRAMLRLGDSAGTIPLIQQYLEQEPVEDTAVRERLVNIQKAIAAQRRLQTDPYYQAGQRGLASLEANKLDEADNLLKQSLAGRPRDSAVVGGLGLLRMRQGRHAEAEAYFQQALSLEPNSNQWKSLIQTARFWGLMRQASDASEQLDFKLALTRLQNALAMNPHEPAALTALARVHTALGQSAQAEKAWREALRYEPANIGALTGLAGLYLQSGRENAIDALLSSLDKTQRDQVNASINAARASALKAKADVLIEKGDREQAITLLEQAALYDRNDPWLRHSLGRLYLEKGQPEKVEPLFAELLKRSSSDAAVHYAYALLQANQDRRQAALATLEPIADQDRNASMVSLQRDLWVGLVLERARAQAQRGRSRVAAEMLDKAQRLVGNDPERSLDLASARIDVGDAQGAQRVLKTLDDTKPPSIVWALRHARLTAVASDKADIQPLINRLSAMPLDSQQQDELRDIQLNHVLQQAETQRAGNHLQAALDLVRPWREKYPLEDRLLAREAGYLRGLGRREDALWRYQQLQTLQPKSRDVANAIIELKIQTGELADARRLIQDETDHLDGATDDQLSDLVAARLDLEDYQEAARLVRLAIEKNPKNPRALAYASRLARQEGRVDEAINLLQQSQSIYFAGLDPKAPATLTTLRLLPASQAPEAETLVVVEPPLPSVLANLEPSYTYRNLAEMLDQKTGWIATSIDQRSRTGTPGVSQYSATEIPVEWKLPQDRNGRLTLHADFVSLNAGALDLAASRNSFGSAALCGAECNTGMLPQEKRGLALNASLQRDTIRWDIGTTPLGFPVQTLVGGMLHKGDIGPFGYSVDISRRALTGSLLSYAGAVDPRTGQVWGGVQANGVRFGLSLDQGGTYGGWSSLGFHQLAGRNVQSNNRMQLMAGGNMRVINKEDELLQFGVTGMHWRMSENAGEYTFGHGGYYSPQAYTSLSFPVTYGQRFERFSYGVRASVSTSRSDTKAAPYYPTDPTLQAADNRFYGGGPGTGTGHSFLVSWEYQLQPRMFLGGLLEIERSPDYAPNRVGLYLRYATDKVSAQPVSFLPAPLQPVSQY